MVEIYCYKNYEEYREAQIEANLRKLHVVYVKEEIVDKICTFLRSHLPKISFGLCHGTRRGVEQALFKKKLGCPVLGTEISPTASQFPDTIEWDFHIAKPEWIGKCDFIYSNALDHAYDPSKALLAWASCLAPNGLLAIEWVDGKPTKSDPFAAPLKKFITFLATLSIAPIHVDLLPGHRQSLLICKLQLRKAE